MIFNKLGRVVDDFYVLGHTWMPTYLLDGDQPILFESGVACLGKIYEESIRHVLGGRNPAILFITHVHYDHCGTAAHLAKVFHPMQITASLLAAQIIARPNAQQLMKELSQRVELLITGVDRGKMLANAFEPFDVTRIVADGDVIRLKNDISISIVATPGHTRDLLSYYIPERKILVATEAAGCADITGHIVPQFIVDYDSYLAGLRRLASLEVNVLCQGHHFVYVGDAVKDFFARSIETTVSFKGRVKELLDVERGSVERVVARIKAEEYDGKPLPKQPEYAYLISLNARVRHLCEKFARK